MSLCMFPKERKKLFKEFQIFVPGKRGDALVGIVGFLLFEIRRIKEDQAGFLFSRNGPHQTFGDIFRLSSGSG